MPSSFATLPNLITVSSALLWYCRTWLMHSCSCSSTGSGSSLRPKGISMVVFGYLEGVMAEPKHEPQMLWPEMDLLTSKMHEDALLS